MIKKKRISIIHLLALFLIAFMSVGISVGAAENSMRSELVSGYWCKASGELYRILEFRKDGSMYDCTPEVYEDLEFGEKTLIGHFEIDGNRLLLYYDDRGYEEFECFKKERIKEDYYQTLIEKDLSEHAFTLIEKDLSEYVFIRTENGQIMEESPFIGQYMDASQKNVRDSFLKYLYEKEYERLFLGVTSKNNTTFQFRKFCFIDLNQDGIEEYNQENNPSDGDGYSVFFRYDNKTRTIERIAIGGSDSHDLKIDNLLGVYYGPEFDKKTNSIMYFSGEGHYTEYFHYDGNNLIFDRITSLDRSRYDAELSITDVQTGISKEYPESKESELLGEPEYEALDWYSIPEEIIDFEIMEKSISDIPEENDLQIEEDKENPNEDEKIQEEIIQDIDYLAFSEIGYIDTDKSDEGKTVEEIISDKKGLDAACYSERPLVKWKSLIQGIKNWRLIKFADNEESGFQAAAYQSPSGKVVITYRGSEDGPVSTEEGTHFKFRDPLIKKLEYDFSLPDLLEPGTEGFKDWTTTDFILFANFNNSQVLEALVFYTDLIGDNQLLAKDVSVTGHSLGGALADIVSAFSSRRAVSFNSAPFLDIAYYYYPWLMATYFTGVDNWTMNAHINSGDTFVGAYQSERKNCLIHDFNDKSSIGSHSLYTFLEEDTEEAQLTSCSEIIPAEGGVWNMNEGQFIAKAVLLGTSGDDNLNPNSSFNKVGIHVFFGGNGNDKLTGEKGTDYFIGGEGNDTIDGSFGHDVYYYHKGDGMDTIHDAGGSNHIYIDGYSADEIEFSEYNGGVRIAANDITIMKISGSIWADYNVHYGEKGEQSHMIKISGWAGKERYEIRCPVDIEIIDNNGKIIAEIPGDKEQSYYFDCGYVYVSKMDDGDFEKIIDLVEGYQIQIVGTDYGVMDVKKFELDDDEMSLVGERENIEVEPQMTATFGNDKKGHSTIVVDYGTNGKKTKTMVLLKEGEIDEKEDFLHKAISMIPFIIMGIGAIGMMISIVVIIRHLRKTK